MTTLALRLTGTCALLAIAAAIADTAAAADEPALQSFATCKTSWFDWKNDAPRMANFEDYIRTRFVPGERGDAFTPKVRTTALGWQVTEVYPQSIGMGLGFSMVVRADFAQARQGLEKLLGRGMTCSTEEGVRSCAVQLGDKKTVMLMTGDNGKAATSLLGCYYVYRQ